ncbi:hypothetical protein Tco_0360699 [Tanacetum coccineum]
MKAEKEKSEKKLKRVMTSQELKAQVVELVAYEAKRAKMMKEYNHCINFRDDPLPITKFSYRKKSDKKRKRMTELIHEVFVKENIVVDGMQRNLTLHQGVVRKAGMVIKEPEVGIFLYNGNFDLVFQRRTSNEGLAECKASTSNLRRIQVRDIVKEVEDYLETYSSAGMDISWYVKGIP